MATKAEKIHALIHTAAAAAAAVGGGLAQAPGSDAAVITPIQVAMKLPRTATARRRQKRLFPNGKLARPDGVEPSASRLEVSCSIQLS